MVKEDSSNVVEVTIECEETSPGLIGPYFDLVVVSSRNEEGLCLVEINAADWSIVFLEAVYQGAHSIVP